MRSWVACMHPDLPNPIEWHHLISATDETRSCVRIFSHHIIWCDSGLPWQLSGAESVCSTGDTGDVGSIPGSERYPGGGNGNSLQYSCWEIP